MPIPKPNDGEGHDAFMSRCMGNDVMVQDFPDESQRAAVCMGAWDDKRAKDATQKQVAWSTFEMKAVDEERRTIEGIATTPSPDRVEDVMEPLGAKFSLPMPFLWQHQSRDAAIGHVFFAKPSKDGIPVKIQMATDDQPGPLKDRLDYAWRSIKKGLVRGLSIGFRGIDVEQIKDSWGMRFKTWEWMELSAVTIPANAEATIQSVKSYAAASGAQPTPGDSGKPVKLKGHTVKTYKDHIKALEATRAAHQARLNEIAKETTEKGETMPANLAEEFDELTGQISAVDVDLKRYRALDKLNEDQAEPIEKAGVPTPGKPPSFEKARVSYPKLEPGIKFARMAMAIARAKMASSSGGGTAEQHYRNESRWMDTAPEVAMALKAAVNAGDTTTATWASELAYAQNIASEFIEYLRPRTIIGRVTGWRSVPFNVRVASQTSGSTGYWVGQGKPIPMSQLATSSVSLGIAKVAGMVSIDKELARLSTPSAETLVRNDLAAECQETLDLSLIDPNQGGQTNIQPASLTYGVTPVTPSGTNYAAFVTDVKSLFSTAIAAQLDISQAVWITSPTTALALSLMVTSLGNPQFPGLSINGGTLMGLPVIVSTQANISGSPQYANMLVLLFPGEVFLADDGQAMVEASDQVAIQMDNAPTNQSTATATATTMVSMFQTESIAIKAVRYINWTKARSQACAFIQATAYA